MTEPDRLPFDPERPLPGPSEPWAASTMPSVRPGPPYHMTEMIAAEPALAARLVRRLAAAEGPVAHLADLVRDTAAQGASIRLVGCGTSEHGAQAGAGILREALVEAGLPTLVEAVQAFEAWQDPPRDGLVIGISHEGGTWATNGALQAAAEAGSRTALVTVSERAPAARLVDIVVTTGELDQSWCHTVGYLSPILAAAALGAAITGRPLEAARLRGLLEAGAATAPTAERLAGALSAAQRLVVLASGADRTAARELALKVEEAAYLPSVARDLETMLHGHLPATDAGTALMLLLTDRQAREARLGRARQALVAAGRLGMPVGAILAVPLDADLAAEATPAGRILVADAPDLPAAVAASLATALPLQLLTERLARARGTNPDTLRRTDAAYHEAAAAVE